ncbi:hypothetical protein GGR57DRAFT_456299 [Xylariaceae sp. FL1272]|nr:hypothetical protein GGR57DRAFT_456299 [Xylariaceae sp. FL1272]
MDPVSGIGLAAATIELTSATFKCYCQIRDLHKAIKFGARDLATATTKLEQHEKFIEELRVNFERAADSFISPKTRDLFQDCIADSKAEVLEFKDLLKHVGKQHFTKRAFQAIETGARLRLNDESIQKYHSLLESQMQRFAFLQSSLQSHATTRLESSVSNIEALIVQQGAIATAFYSRSDSGQATSRKELTSAKTSSISGHTSSLFLENNTTTSEWHNLIHTGYDVQRRKYYTLGGVVTVLKSSSYRDDRTAGASAFRIVFEPYSWISNAYVEWRCVVPSPQSPMWMFASSTSVVCDDDDVLEALGLIRRPRSGSCSEAKIPNSKKVKHLLDTGRLLKEHVIRYEHGIYRDVLSALIEWHQPCRCTNYAGIHFGRFNIWHRDQDVPRYQVQLHAEVWEVINLLLCRNFKPHLSSWKHIYDYAAEDHWHVQNDDAHRELRLVMGTQHRSIPRLILKACGHPIALPVLMSFHHRLQLSWSSKELGGVQPGQRYIVSWAGASASPRGLSGSYLGHVITSGPSCQRLKKEIEDLGINDLVDDEFTFDRWLIVLYASIQREVNLFLCEYMAAYKSPSRRLWFTLDHVYREIQQAPADQSDRLIEFVSSHGNVSLFQRFGLPSPNAGSVARWQLCAAQSQNPSSLDLLIDKGGCNVEVLPHTTGVIERVVRDPVFAVDFVNFCVSQPAEGWGNNDLSGPFIAFLSSPLGMRQLFRDETCPLPDYMRIYILGFLKRYEVDTVATPHDVHKLIFRAMEHHWELSKTAEDLLRDLHFYKVLRLVAHAPAFQSSIDGSDMNSPVCFDRVPYWDIQPTESPYPPVDGLSALMLALHCGMKPAVDILVDAGASITKPAACGKSALQLAQENAKAHHPRQWVAMFSRDGQLVGMDMGGFHHPHGNLSKLLWIPESTDREMLEILLQALRDRGEEIIDVADKPPPSKWDILKGQSRKLVKWLFKSHYEYNAETLRENSIYVLLVTILSLLSTLKVLRSEFGDTTAKIARLLSKPIVLFALFGLFLSLFFRSGST